MKLSKEKAIEAYFRGGNAKDKNASQLKADLDIIIEVVEREDRKGTGIVRE